eukprot:UN17606
MEIKLIFIAIFFLAALVSSSEDQERKAKLFFISTSSTTSTVSTSTYCYTAGANAACGRKRGLLNTLKMGLWKLKTWSFQAPQPQNGMRMIFLARNLTRMRLWWTRAYD